MTTLALAVGAVLVLSVWILVEVRADDEPEDREVIAGFTPLPSDDEWEDDE